MAEFSPMYEVTRFIKQNEPGNHAHRSFEMGELLFKYLGYDYDAVNFEEGVCASENGSTAPPFFQLPKDAVKEVE